MTRMDTTDIKALLSAIIDDELTTEQRHNVERTLADSPEARALVDEAERLNDMIVRDAAFIGGDSGANELPPGFEQAVLLRTTRQAPVPYAHQWTTWLGWVAAAACLALALTMYVTSPHAWNKNNTIATPGGGVSDQLAADTNDTVGDSVGNVRTAGFAMKSWTLDGMQPAGEFAADRYGQARAISTSRFDGLPPIDYSDPALLLDDNDAAALHVAGMLLEDLAVLDDLNDADARRMADVIAFDQLGERLSEIRRRVDGASSSALMAVESILHRIEHGPIDADVLQDIQRDVRQLDLDQQVMELRDAVTDMYRIPESL